MEVTQWFEIDVDGQPNRKGWYEVKYQYTAGNFMRYWDGKKWFKNDDLEWTYFGNSSTEEEKWRGLARNPE